MRAIADRSACDIAIAAANRFRKGKSITSNFPGGLGRRYRRALGRSHARRSVICVLEIGEVHVKRALDGGAEAVCFARWARTFALAKAVITSLTLD
jgi:hypothetical protein